MIVVPFVARAATLGQRAWVSIGPRASSRVWAIGRAGAVSVAVTVIVVTVITFIAGAATLVAVVAGGVGVGRVTAVLVLGTVSFIGDMDGGRWPSHQRRFERSRE